MLISVGIIGFGPIGIQHAAVLSALEDSEVKAICDKESYLTKLVKKIVPTIKVYSEYERMIERESLDAVYVCTPVQSHAAIVERLIARNPKINLFVEKPLATNYEEAQALVNLAKTKSDGINMVGFHRRFTGVYKKARDYLSLNVIGEPVFFRSYLYSSDVLKPVEGWKFDRKTGGPTLEFSPHLLDLLIWYFGDPVSVQAVDKSLFSVQVEDFVHAVAKYESGLVGYVDVSWSMRNYRPYEMLIEVHGKNGTLSVNQDKLDLYIDNDVPGVISRGMYRHYGATLIPPVPYLLTSPEYTLEDAYFLDCIRRHHQPEQGFEAGARVNRLISMIHESATR